MTECSICKFRNHDSAVYCADCGQRLQPATNSSSKLHSPLLDSHSAGIEPIENSVADLPNTRPPAQPTRPNPNSHNGLHSPLLDVHSSMPDSFGNSQTKPKTSSMFAELSGTHGIIANNQPAIHNNNFKGSKLHSPVLDAPAGGFEPENVDLPVEEYNSLRSPLLASKVPLPETPKPAPEAQPVAKSVPQPPPTIGPETTVSSLFGPLSQQSEPNYKQFATSLFESAPAKEPTALTPRQTGRFTKVASLKKESDSPSAQPTPFTKSIKSSGSQSVLLPDSQEFDRYPSAETAGSAVLKFLAILLLLASLVFKFCYWWKGLGPALIASQTFLLDQFGQVIVILLLIMIIWKGKF